jgi:hypothetical protein
VEAAAPTLLSIHRLDLRKRPSLMATTDHFYAAGPELALYISSGPNAESDVSSRKQSLEKILPGGHSRTWPLHEIAPISLWKIGPNFRAAC